MPLIFSHDRLLRFAGSGRISVLDSAGRPLAHFGVSTRTRTVEDQRHAVEFAQTPELLHRVTQLLGELDEKGYASALVERVREAAAACRPTIPG